MARLFPSDPHCVGATVGANRRYDSDRQGFVHVDNAADERALKSAGYVVAGRTVASKAHYVCPGCGWRALIRHCPKCDSSELEKVAA